MAGGMPLAPPAVTFVFPAAVLPCGADFMEEVRALHKRTNVLGERGARAGSPARERVSAFAVCCSC